MSARRRQAGLQAPSPRRLAGLLRGGWHGIAIQAAIVILAGTLLVVIAGNVAANLDRLHVRTGFGFLTRPAGFDISLAFIAYDERSSYLTAFWVALLNTVIVTAMAALFATLLGFAVALARLSGNRLVALAGTLFVETIRNIPLLLQLLFWYFAVLRPLPGPKQSLGLGGWLFLNNRGLFFPLPVFDHGAGIFVLALLAGLVLSAALHILVRRRRVETGRDDARAWVVPLPLLLLPAAAWLSGTSQAQWSLPQLAGFNFRGGGSVTPELFALTLGLTIYTAAFIAEILRGSIQAVAPGQIEAARALGLKNRQITRMIVVPQALRSAIPPLGSQYVVLLRNSSLGSAIAYPDLMHVFAGTALNQTGQPVEIMLITLATYLLLGMALSGATNYANRWALR